MSEKKKILELRKLKKYFPVAGNRKLKAVEDVSFVLYEGEKLGVVGESGCGKSTLGRTILQLYEQTSGSCVYYGKSIQELNPAYIRKEIASLKDYQKRAVEFYQKSLKEDEQIKALNGKCEELDPDGSDKDARKYDKLQNQIDKLRFRSGEFRKDASRQLREASRTVGSLILSKDIDQIAALFNKAEDEVQAAHDDLVRYKENKNHYENNLLILEQLENNAVWIKELEEKSELSEEEKYHLADLKHIAKKIATVDPEKIKAENAVYLKKMEEYEASSQRHHEIEMSYRKEAFDRYHGVNYLPITERTLDKAYQDKLDANYETGINLSKLSKKEMASIRPDLQMVFQDPAASLDPRESVGRAIEEVFEIHSDMSSLLRRQKTLQLLSEVGLKSEHYYAYPHSLSGGMKQRVGIARAIALEPSFVVLDEAVSALDVSVQAQILQLLERLRKQKNLTYLFITHDLGVVRHFCDRVIVMYLGNVCELADNEDLFKNPLHPYTKSLLEAVPRMRLDRKENKEDILQGEVPSPLDPPSGCPFHTRCKQCMDICKKEKPKGFEIADGHLIFCHLYDKENDDEL